MLNETEKRIEHVNDFIGSTNPSRYHVLFCVARQVFEHLLDVFISFESTLLRKMPSRAFDNGNQAANCNVVQPQEMRHYCFRDSLSKEHYDRRLRVSVENHR